jgi:Uma2 family endonuclease
MSVARQLTGDERDLYPVHEEDNVPVRPAHEYQVWVLLTALRSRLHHYWITGDVCMYWEEGAFNRYVAPDVLVLPEMIEGDDPGVYLRWRDPQPLLTIEIGSKSTFREDEGPKIERYLADLGVREYLYYKPHRLRRWRSLKLWRLEAEEAVEVSVTPEGRLPSGELGLEFGLEESGLLRLYEPDGSLVPLPEEQQHRLHQALGRAEQERERAAALEHELERLREELRRRETTRLDAAD